MPARRTATRIDGVESTAISNVSHGVGGEDWIATSTRAPHARAGCVVVATHAAEVSERDDAIADCKHVAVSRRIDCVRPQRCAP